MIIKKFEKPKIVSGLGNHETPISDGFFNLEKNFKELDNLKPITQRTREKIKETKRFFEKLKDISKEERESLLCYPINIHHPGDPQYNYSLDPFFHYQNP